MLYHGYIILQPRTSSGQQTWPEPSPDPLPGSETMPNILSAEEGKCPESHTASSIGLALSGQIFVEQKIKNNNNKRGKLHWKWRVNNYKNAEQASALIKLYCFSDSYTFPPAIAAFVNFFTLLIYLAINLKYGPRAEKSAGCRDIDVGC